MFLRPLNCQWQVKKVALVAYMRKTSDLLTIINMLVKRNEKLDATRYLQALWTKLIDPVTTGVMVLLALPFIFGPLRSVSLTQRVLAGFLVGITFHIINRAFNYLGQIYLLNPALTAVVPSLLFFIFTLGWLKRVR